MKIGDIIRRSLKNGTPIGQYIIITGRENGRILGTYINRTREFYIENIEFYKVVKTVKLLVSQEDFDNIRKKHLRVYRHLLPSVRWEKALKSQHDLLILYTRKGDCMYYKEYKLEKHTRVTTKVYARRSDERDIKERQLYVKVSLLGDCMWITTK